MATTLEAPAENAVAVTPNNSTDLDYPSRFLYVGVEGDLTVDLLGAGTNVTFSNMANGYHPLRVTRVYATGTTATGIISCS